MSILRQPLPIKSRISELKQWLAPDERLIAVQKVDGSNPSGCATQNPEITWFFALHLADAKARQGRQSPVNSPQITSKTSTFRQPHLLLQQALRFRLGLAGTQIRSAPKGEVQFRELPE